MKRKAEDDVGGGGGRKPAASVVVVNKDEASADRNGDDDGGNKNAEWKAPASNDKAPPPPYGTKEYWEARYRSHLTQHRQRRRCRGSGSGEGEGEGSLSAKDEVGEGQPHEDDDANSNEKDSSSSPPPDHPPYLSKEAMRPGHEWYFSYGELRPILLPLLLGRDDAEGWQKAEHAADGEEVDDEEDNDDEEEEEEGENKIGEGEEVDDGVCCKREDDGMEGSNDDGDDGGDDDENDDITPRDDNDEIDDNSTPGCGDERDRNEEGGRPAGPQRVLEIGCGDVPLGDGLASDLLKLQSETGVDARNVVDRIMCVDYSETVIDILRDRQKDKDEAGKANGLVASSKRDGKESEESEEKKLGDDAAAASSSAAADDVSSLRVEYGVADARNLPYPSNSFHLVLDKGTLDAMLSDQELGVVGCISIVAEMARCTAVGGHVLIVSHLNANHPFGLRWLDEVVVPGLRRASIEANGAVHWEVEVHGSDEHGGDESDDGDEGSSSMEDEVDIDRNEEESDKDVAIRGEGGNVGGTAAEASQNSKADGGGSDDDGTNDHAATAGEEDNDDPMAGNRRLGPAVYIVRKLPLPPTPPTTPAGAPEAVGEGSNSINKEEEDLRTIPLKFFCY